MGTSQYMGHLVRVEFVAKCGLLVKFLLPAEVKTLPVRFSTTHLTFFYTQVME